MAIPSHRSPCFRASPGPHSFIEISPPRPWKASDELPAIVDMPSFQRVHRQLDDKLKAYLGWPHSNYQTLARDAWNELRRSDADLLFSCNAEARIRFAEILCAQLESFGIIERGPHNWITVTPAEFVLPLERAHEFQPQKLVALIREALGDHAGYRHHRSSPLSQVGARRTELAGPRQLARASSHVGAQSRAASGLCGEDVET